MNAVAVKLVQSLDVVYSTVAIWMPDESGIWMIDLCPVVKWSGIQMVVWKLDWNSLLMVQNVGYSNGQPSHVTLPFENRTPIMSSIQIFTVFPNVFCFCKNALLIPTRSLLRFSHLFRDFQFSKTRNLSLANLRDVSNQLFVTKIQRWQPMSAQHRWILLYHASENSIMDLQLIDYYFYVIQVMIRILDVCCRMDM